MDIAPKWETYDINKAYYLSAIEKEINDYYLFIQFF